MENQTKEIIFKTFVVLSGIISFFGRGERTGRRNMAVVRRFGGLEQALEQGWVDNCCCGAIQIGLGSSRGSGLGGGRLIGEAGAGATESELCGREGMKLRGAGQGTVLSVLSIYIESIQI